MLSIGAEWTQQRIVGKSGGRQTPAAIPRSWPEDHQNGGIRVHFIRTGTARPRLRLVQEKIADVDRFWRAIGVRCRRRSKRSGVFETARQFIAHSECRGRSTNCGLGKYAGVCSAGRLRLADVVEGREDVHLGRADEFDALARRRGRRPRSA